MTIRRPNAERLKPYEGKEVEGILYSNNTPVVGVLTDIGRKSNRLKIDGVEYLINYFYTITIQNSY